MTKILIGDHAELIGTQMVEPLGEFDETQISEEELEALEADGKVADVTAPAKSGGK